jgi:hypothetical protein
MIQGIIKRGGIFRWLFEVIRPAHKRNNYWIFTINWDEGAVYVAKERRPLNDISGIWIRHYPGPGERSEVDFQMGSYYLESVFVIDRKSAEAIAEEISEIYGASIFRNKELHNM